MTAVPAEIARRFRCPCCESSMEVRGAGLVCPEGHVLERRDGYLDASAGRLDATTQKTFDSFGYEWTRFSKIQPEDESYFREYFAAVKLERLDECVALDAGCGKGRYTRFAARYVRAMAALDGSEAVSTAARNLADLPNVVVVKGDLREAPFAPASFDFVSCLGVLHHLADPRSGFDALVRLLAPGGRLLVYLYSRPTAPGVRATGLAGAELLRTITVRLPHQLTRTLAAPIAACLYAALVLPGAIGDRLGVERLARLPLTAYRRRPVRSLWLDTFDRLSAPLERRYIWSEVEPWFQEAGLKVESVIDTAGLTVLACRPPAEPPPP